MNTKCFIYSKQQFEQMKEIEGKNIKLGIVVVNGKPKQYTDIISSMRNARYGDSILIYEGDISKVRYTLRS